MYSKVRVYSNRIHTIILCTHGECIICLCVVCERVTALSLLLYIILDECKHWWRAQRAYLSCTMRMKQGRSKVIHKHRISAEPVCPKIRYIIFYINIYILYRKIVPFVRLGRLASLTNYNYLVWKCVGFSVPQCLDKCLACHRQPPPLQPLPVQQVFSHHPLHGPHTNTSACCHKHFTYHAHTHVQSCIRRFLKTSIHIQTLWLLTHGQKWIAHFTMYMYVLYRH